VVAHIVLFRPRAGLTPDERTALVNAFSRALGEIPGIRRATVGKRVTHGRPYEQLMQENYEFAAVLEFDDLDALKAYLQHPAHEALGERFFASFDAALIYDYEMTEGTQGFAKLV
jgi:Stress responsive A/B Barrel Domain